MPDSLNSRCSGHRLACPHSPGTFGCGRAIATARSPSMHRTLEGAGAPRPRLTCRAPMKLQPQSTAVFPKRDALVRREFLSLSQIPYTAHLSEHVIRTKAGDYVQVFRLSGASFE